MTGVNEFNQLFGGFTITQITTFILALLFILGIYQKIIKPCVKAYVNKCQREAEMSQTVSDFKDFKKNFEKMSDMLEKHIADDNERTVITLRSTLWRLHDEFMSQKYVTREGLSIFNESCEAYKKAGGNGVVKHKLQPEVLSLPIKE